MRWINLSSSESDVMITIYANSITLTPGTVTVLIEKDKLFVHALDESFMSDLESCKMLDKIKYMLRNFSKIQCESNAE